MNRQDAKTPRGEEAKAWPEAFSDASSGLAPWCLGGSLLFRSRVLKEVKPAVFRATNEVRDTVAIEIDDGRADVVAFNVRLRQSSGVFESPHAVFETGLLQKVGVGAVEQEVELAVAVPIGRTEFATAALAGGSMDALCSTAGASPFGGMVPMYLLMSAFHLAPWLKLIGSRARLSRVGEGPA